jgi:hypothetical protein
MQSAADASLASVSGLGAFKSDHSPSYETRRTGLILQTGFVIVGLALIVAAFVWIGLSSSGVRFGDSSFAFVPLCFGCLAVPVGFFGLFNAWRNWGKGAALYENGFAYKDSRGVRPVNWNDIEAVWQNVTKHYRNGVYNGTTYVYTVLTNDQKRMVLDTQLPGIEQLGNEILRGSSVALFPRYWQTLQGGQRVSFGPLAIDQHGIYHGTKSLPWSEIKAIRIHQGVIAVKKEGGWFNWASVTVPQIPNFYIFYDLVKRFATVE